MRKNNKGLLAGSIILEKRRGECYAAFLPGRCSTIAKRKDFHWFHERIVAKVLYNHGLIDDPNIELVTEGGMTVFPGVYIATMVFTIVLSFAEEPNSLSEIRRCDLPPDELTRFDKLLTYVDNPACIQSFIRERENIWRTRSQMWAAIKDHVEETRRRNNE